jgi:hypothetical protein
MGWQPATLPEIVLEIEKKNNKKKQNKFTIQFGFLYSHKLKTSIPAVG